MSKRRGDGDGYNVIVTNGSMTEIRDVKATHEKSTDARNAAWLVVAMVVILFFALLAWTSPMYREYGLSATSAGLVLFSMYTVAFTVAIPVFGLLSRAHDRRGWLAVCAALSGAGTLGMALAPLLMPHGWMAQIAGAACSPNRIRCSHCVYGCLVARPAKRLIPWPCCSSLRSRCWHGRQPIGRIREAVFWMCDGI